MKLCIESWMRFRCSLDAACTIRNALVRDSEIIIRLTIVFVIFQAKVPAYSQLIVYPRIVIPE